MKIEPLEVGVTIKLIREASKLTQKELGNLVGCERSNIANIENQYETNITLDRFTKLFNVLGYSVDILINKIK